MKAAAPAGGVLRWTNSRNHARRTFTAASPALFPAITRSRSALAASARAAASSSDSPASAIPSPLAQLRHLGGGAIASG